MRKILLAMLFSSSVFSQCIGDSNETSDKQAFQKIDQNILHLEKIYCEMEMFKGETLTLKNDFVNLVLMKNELLDEILKTLTLYFMQKRICESDPHLEKKLLVVHSMIFILGQIKNNIDVALIYNLKQQMNVFKSLLSRQDPYKMPPYKEMPKRVKPRRMNLSN